MVVSNKKRHLNLEIEKNLKTYNFYEEWFLLFMNEFKMFSYKIFYFGSYIIIRHDFSGGYLPT